MSSPSEAIESPTKSRNWPYPGKILIIDDEYNEYVRDATEQLLKSGASVAYWNGKSRKKLVNIRIVLLDIDFSGQSDDPDEEPYYYDAADILKVIPGAPLVFILSSTYKKKQSELLRMVYEKRNHQKKFHGIISKIGMRKDQLNTNTLVRKVKSSLDPYLMMQILLEWEAVIDNARDGTVEVLFKDESTNVLRQLIKDIDKESGRNSLVREFTSLCTRLLLRFAKKGTAFSSLSKKLASIASDSITVPPATEEILTSLMMHYYPEGEGAWTGDIYRTGKQGTREFAIVLNPKCDFAQGKVHHLSVCYGFEISEKKLNSTSNPIYHADHDLRRTLSGEKDDILFRNKPISKLKRLRKAHVIQEAKRNYIAPKCKVPPRFQVLRHVNVKRNGKIRKIQICFDFQNVESLDQVFILDSDLAPWKRISRLDEPYIDALLQSLGGYVSRMGVPAVNTPD